jgi:hypothetical protein
VTFETAQTGVRVSSLVVVNKHILNSNVVISVILAVPCEGSAWTRLEPITTVRAGRRCASFALSATILHELVIHIIICVAFLASATK